VVPGRSGISERALTCEWPRESHLSSRGPGTGDGWMLVPPHPDRCQHPTSFSAFLYSWAVDRDRVHLKPCTTDTGIGRGKPSSARSPVSSARYFSTLS
jgi:hypothetical protein